MAIQVHGELLTATEETVKGRNGGDDWLSRKVKVFGGSDVHTVFVNERFDTAAFNALVREADKRPTVVLDVTVSQKGALYLDRVVSAEVPA